MDTLELDAKGVILVAGRARGEVLFADTPLSFWGGVDATSGDVIDRNHPLFGCNIAGRILAIPGGRGSCTGSSVIMELILNGHGPAGMIFSRREDILALGVVVAQEMFGASIPVVELAPGDFDCLKTAKHLAIDGARVGSAFASIGATTAEEGEEDGKLILTESDHAMIAGEKGEAAAVAMRIICRMARILGAGTLIDISQAHIDGCIYTGPASLDFARRLCALGARVAVPTTLNAISVDQMNWRRQGTDPALGEPASALADAYVAMGAAASFTCAPYLLPTAPKRGQDVVWAESNAVVFANSVLGARTMKYPDYLDICIALTGRAPLAGCHLEEQRKATVHIAIEGVTAVDDMFFPLLGYHAGLLAPSGIPVLTGLETLSPSLDDLKSLSAAFGTTSASPMFHIVGHTPEAATLDDATGGREGIPLIRMHAGNLADSWHKLNLTRPERIDLVSLGNPHFSLDEFRALAYLCRGRRRDPQVSVVVTTARATRDRLAGAGLLEPLEEFGVEIVVDACWCTVSEPVIPPAAKAIVTNSAKYAHYGPGLSGRSLSFASLADCVQAACCGRVPDRLPDWLQSACAARGQG